VTGRVLYEPGLVFSADALAGFGAPIEVAPPPWEGDDVVGIITWAHRVGDPDLARLPALRVVATPSVGFDHIDVVAAARRGVAVCNVPDYCVEEVADSTIALLLALLRGVVELDRSVRAGEWRDWEPGPLRRVAGARLGVVGFGRIGRAVARRAAALGMEVWAADPLVPAETVVAAGGRPAAFDELLRACDAVTLHLPLTAETDGLIGGAELARMPRGSYLVNTARGRLVDVDAVVGALESGHLAGAALDVLPVEPPTPEHPAPRAPGLIVTPHAGWYTPQAKEAVHRRVLEAVRTVLEDREPPELVKP
jgi:D-3-phosphoglycerate dehydrogenase